MRVTHAFHLAYTPRERMRRRSPQNARELPLPPPRPIAGHRFQGHGDAENMRRLTETDASIGPPEEIVKRLKVYARHRILIDVGGSREALRIFGKEIRPEFRETARCSGMERHAPDPGCDCAWRCSPSRRVSGRPGRRGISLTHPLRTNRTRRRRGTGCDCSPPSRRYRGAGHRQR